MDKNIEDKTWETNEAPSSEDMGSAEDALNDIDGIEEDTVKKPTRDKKPYPKKGDCHFRIGEYEWAILDDICADRACGINEAIGHAIRRYKSRANDQEYIATKLTLINGNLDDIFAYTKDIAYTGEELTKLLDKSTL